MNETTTARRSIPLSGIVIAAMRAARARFDARRAQEVDGSPLSLADAAERFDECATAWQTRIKAVTGIGVSVLAVRDWAGGDGFTLTAQLPPDTGWQTLAGAAAALSAAANLPPGVAIRIEQEATFPGWVLLHVPTGPGGHYALEDQFPGIAGAWNLFADVADITAWLDACNPAGPHEDGMRVLKLVEEAGEAAAAYIGMVGQNPRKGVTHSLDDVLGELADVAVTALCAMQHFTQNQTATRAVMARKVSGIIARAGIPRRPGAGVDPDQAWFWEPQWLAGEREAGAQLAAGGLPVYDDMAALLADIDTDTDTDVGDGDDADGGDGGPQDLVESCGGDNPFGPSREPVTLGELHALARRVRRQVEAEWREFEADEHARMLELAEHNAAVAWDETFAEDGQAPPPLRWKGYADRATDGAWHLCAAAHLGDAVFLAHTHDRAPAAWHGPDAARDLFEVIAPCACKPNRYRQDPVRGLVDLADVLDQILTAAPVCTGTCAASSSGVPDARPGRVAVSEDAA